MTSQQTTSAANDLPALTHEAKQLHDKLNASVSRDVIAMNEHLESCMTTLKCLASAQESFL